MTITTTQKIIRIGSSKGTTLPAKELKALGVDVGDEVRVTVEAIRQEIPQQDLIREYKAFR